MSYLKKTLHGLTWTTLLRSSVRLVTFLKIAVLARVIGLSPEQFGVFGVVTIVLGLLEMFTETGVNVFLMQERGKWEKYINTAWVISICRAVLISCLMWILSGFIGNFFNAPEAVNLIRLATLIPLIRGFVNPSCIRLVKELNFMKEFWYRTGILVVETIVALAVVSMTQSAIGLVWGLIFAAIFEVAMSFIIIKPQPKFKFDMTLGKEIISSGKWITSFGIFDYAVANIDNIIVGRLLGANALGVYQNAYKLSTVPLTELNDIVYKTAFPVFVDMNKNQPSKSKDAAFKTALSTVMTMIPISIILYFFAGPIVQIVLGPGWESAVSVVKILAFLGLFRGLSSSCNFLFMAERKQKYVTIISLVQLSWLGLLIVPSVKMSGVNGAGHAAIAAALLTLPVSIVFIYKILSKQK